MKIIELRIGNWAMYDDGTIATVHSIDSYRDTVALDGFPKALASNVVLPIPLTPLILEKCGFKYDDDKQWWYWNPELQNFEIRICKLPFTYEDWHISKGFMTWNDELRDVKYLHELQNAIYFGLGYEINYTP